MRRCCASEPGPAVRFLIHLSNHSPSGLLSLHDLIEWVRNGLEEAGHVVEISHHEVAGDAINLFFEAFRPAVAEEIVATGVRFGIVATEMPDGTGFNAFRDFDWRDRWHGFERLAPHASFIWALAEQTVATYARHAPTSHLPLGFLPQMLPAEEEARSFDFCFLGLATPHRRALLARLSRHASVLWPEKYVAPDEFRRLAGRARVGLCLRLGENWEYPSYTRIGRFLHAQTAMAAEYTPHSCYLSGYHSTASRDEDFVDYALAQLAGDPVARAKESLAAYARDLPMAEILADRVAALALQPAGGPRRRLELDRHYHWSPRYWERVAGDLAGALPAGDLALYGAGQVTRALLPLLGRRVRLIVDRDPARAGTAIGGIPVCGLERLRDCRAFPLVVTPYKRKQEIAPLLAREQLQTVYIDDLLHATVERDAELLYPPAAN